MMHKSILLAPEFIDGSYTTQFIEKNLKIRRPKLFHVVDDHVFLITAAIAAYNDKKSRNELEYPSDSKWKGHSRQKSLRKL